LEERLMNDEIEGSIYKTWFKKYKEEKAELEFIHKQAEINNLEPLLPTRCLFITYLKSKRKD